MKKRTPIDKLRAKIWIEGIRFETGLNCNEMDRRFLSSRSVRGDTGKAIQNGTFAKMLRLGVLPDAGKRVTPTKGLVHAVDVITARRLSARLYLPLWTLCSVDEHSYLYHFRQFLDSYYATLPPGFIIYLVRSRKLPHDNRYPRFLIWASLWKLMEWQLPNDVARLTFLLAIVIDRSLDTVDGKRTKREIAGMLEVRLRADPIFGPHVNELFDYLYEKIFPNSFRPYRPFEFLKT